MGEMRGFMPPNESAAPSQQPHLPPTPCPTRLVYVLYTYGIRKKAVDEMLCSCCQVNRAVTCSAWCSTLSQSKGPFSRYCLGPNCRCWRKGSGYWTSLGPQGYVWIPSPNRYNISPSLPFGLGIHTNSRAPLSFCAPHPPSLAPLCLGTFTSPSLFSNELDYL
jgi:hypothetical protein